MNQRERLLQPIEFAAVLAGCGGLAVAVSVEAQPATARACGERACTRADAEQAFAAARAAYDDGVKAAATAGAAAVALPPGLVRDRAERHANEAAAGYGESALELRWARDAQNAGDFDASKAHANKVLAAVQRARAAAAQVQAISSAG